MTDDDCTEYQVSSFDHVSHIVRALNAKDASETAVSEGIFKPMVDSDGYPDPWVPVTTIDRWGELRVFRVFPAK